MNTIVTNPTETKTYRAKYDACFFERKKIPSYALWAVYVKEDGHYPKIPQGYGKTDTLEQAHLALTAWLKAHDIAEHEIRKDMIPWMLVKQLLEGKNGAEYMARQVRRNGTKKDLPAITDEIKSMVFLSHGKIITTSLIVADRFGKRHDNVLQAIDNLPEDDFRLLNFKETIRDIPGPKGAIRQTRVVEMTWKGFSMLAMGFTGKKAYQWKQKFLNAFEAMGKEIDRLNSQQSDKNWKLVRDETKLGYKWMSSALKDSREEQGKDTASHHYSNEARLINSIMTNQFTGLDRDNLDKTMLTMIGNLQLENTKLIAKGFDYQKRKEILRDKLIKKIACDSDEPLPKTGRLENGKVVVPVSFSIEDLRHISKQHGL